MLLLKTTVSVFSYQSFNPSGADPVYHIYHIYIYSTLVVIVPADDLAPNGVRLSADKEITTSSNNI